VRHGDFGACGYDGVVSRSQDLASGAESVRGNVLSYAKLLTIRETVPNNSSSTSVLLVGSTTAEQRSVRREAG